jgi:hypothetical protein
MEWNQMYSVVAVDEMELRTVRVCTNCSLVDP